MNPRTLCCINMYDRRMKSCRAILCCLFDLLYCSPDVGQRRLGCSGWHRVGCRVLGVWTSVLRGWLGGLIIDYYLFPDYYLLHVVNFFLFFSKFLRFPHDKLISLVLLPFGRPVQEDSSYAMGRTSTMYVIVRTLLK